MHGCLLDELEQGGCSKSESVVGVVDLLSTEPCFLGDAEIHTSVGAVGVAGVLVDAVDADCVFWQRDEFSQESDLSVVELSDCFELFFVSHSVFLLGKEFSLSATCRLASLSSTRGCVN